ncbi:MAG: acyltransferase family protein [Ignavibacteriae bacterium]|nr:acyltransferase family protein [Ignavibacteriota bacterium]
MKTERRYDIDWIRVIAFDFLIIYHVGMFFVPWDYELKNNEIVDWMRWPMLFVNQWRLSILFVVSGMGTRFALSQRTGGEFILERVKRLFIPLVAGIFLLVAPVVYLVRLSEGVSYSSYFDFYSQFFNGTYPEGNFSWGHLWFLPYLLLMSIIATPLFLNLRNSKNKFIISLNYLVKKTPFSLFLFIIPLFITEFFLKDDFPITHALFFGEKGDWYAITYYFILFITGFTLISLGKSLWIALDKVKFYALIIGILSFPLMIWMWYNTENSFLIPLMKTINMWSWILAIFAFSSNYLNKESKTIEYRNKAVYPYYILHFTITLFIGYLLMDNQLHYIWKFMIMTIGTFGILGLFYEFVIKRIKILKPLFGIKTPKNSS